MGTLFRPPSIYFHNVIRLIKYLKKLVDLQKIKLMV